MNMFVWKTDVFLGLLAIDTGTFFETFWCWGCPKNYWLAGATATSPVASKMQFAFRGWTADFFGNVHKETRLTYPSCERPPKPPTIRNSFTRTLVLETIRKLSGTIGLHKKRWLLIHMFARFLNLKTFIQQVDIGTKWSLQKHSKVVDQK